jgi:hypothetical protein
MSHTFARGVIVVLVVATFAGLAAFAYRETRQEERDRHALQAMMSDLERSLRRHDADFWMYVEGAHPRGVAPEGDSAHRQVLEDFERLSHLEGFAMKDRQVEVRGDHGVVRYRIVGQLPPGKRGPLPSAGELKLRRTAKGWDIVSHRLMDAR